MTCLSGSVRIRAMESKDIQVGLINVVMGGAILWYLLGERNLFSLELLIFWLATGSFLFHWYWGLIAFVRYIGPTESFAEFMLDIAAVCAQVSTIFWIGFPLLWFALNGISFTLAILKYVLTLRTRGLSAPLADYVKEKMRIHAAGAAGMFLGAFMSFHFFGYVWFFGLLTLISHLLVMSYLMAKKVYVLRDF